MALSPSSPVSPKSPWSPWSPVSPKSPSLLSPERASGPAPLAPFTPFDSANGFAGLSDPLREVVGRLGRAEPVGEGGLPVRAAGRGARGVHPLADAAVVPEVVFEVLDLLGEQVGALPDQGNLEVCDRLARLFAVP